MGGKEITIEIKKPEIIFLLIFLSIILVLELQLTFNSPIAFGDEGFHTRLAQWIAEEKEYPIWTPFEQTKLVKWGASRPPAWNLLEASMYFIFGFNDGIVKFLTPFIGVVLTGIVVFILGKILYNKEIGLIAAIITITISSFVTYSVLFYTDILFVFYFSLFILTFFLAISNKKEKYWILSGVFAGLTFLTKTVGFVIFPFLFLVILYQVYKKYELKLMIKNYILLFVLFFILTGSFFLRNMIYYHTPSCENFVFFKGDGCSQTYEYNTTKNFEGSIQQTTGTAQNFLNMGIINYFNFAYGNIWFVPLSFICGLILIGTRKNVNDLLIILLLIAFLSIFYISSSGRAEDTSRYTIGLVPIIALIAGNYFDVLYDFIKNHYKYFSLIIFIFVLVFSYLNFNEKLITMFQVKKFSPAFFEACDFVKKNTTDDALIMTVWDHQTAYNCQRNVICLQCLPESADLVLGNDVNFTLEKLEKNDITHIFIQKFSLGTSNLGTVYPISFVQLLDNNPKNFIKIFENGPSVQQCVQSGGCDGSIIYEIKY
jgi:hypothetical protein